MNDILGIIATVFLVGAPVFAWVVRVEKKLTDICAALRHIHLIIERRSVEREDFTDAKI